MFNCNYFNQLLQDCLAPNWPFNLHELPIYQCYKRCLLCYINKCTDNANTEGMLQKMGLATSNTGFVL